MTPNTHEESAGIGLWVLVKMMRGWGIKKSWALKIMRRMWDEQDKEVKQ